MGIRTILATTATTVGLLAVGMAPAAHATQTAPAPAPANSSVQGALAGSPTTSPTAPYTRQSASTGYTCATGNFCASVYDPNGPSGKKWKVFKFSTCHTYSLSNWGNVGTYVNRQYGSRATAKIYGQSGETLRTVPIGSYDSSYNWNPAWKIRNCY